MSASDDIVIVEETASTSQAQQKGGRRLPLSAGRKDFSGKTNHATTPGGSNNAKGSATMTAPVDLLSLDSPVPVVAPVSDDDGPEVDLEAMSWADNIFWD